MGKEHWTGYVWEDLSWPRKNGFVAWIQLDGVFGSFGSCGVRAPFFLAHNMWVLLLFIKNFKINNFFFFYKIKFINNG